MIILIQWELCLRPIPPDSVKGMAHRAWEAMRSEWGVSLTHSFPILHHFHNRPHSIATLLQTNGSVCLWKVVDSSGLGTMILAKVGNWRAAKLSPKCTKLRLNFKIFPEVRTIVKWAGRGGWHFRLTWVNSMPIFHFVCNTALYSVNAIRSSLQFLESQVSEWVEFNAPPDKIQVISEAEIISSLPWRHGPWSTICYTLQTTET